MVVVPSTGGPTLQTHLSHNGERDAKLLPNKAEYLAVSARFLTTKLVAREGKDSERILVMLGTERLQFAVVCVGVATLARHVHHQYRLSFRERVTGTSA